ncbi:MAG TPA: 3-oxo-tetronate kinase [Mycobacteriales bacterium]|nr:3-oxo-tetronate kinase [Mycobacteriales bacterium]
MNPRPSASTPLLGCIADDVTGATDLAGSLVRSGMRVVQLLGVPRAEEPAPDAEAVVVALKSRTAPVDSAVRDSLGALEWLLAAGVRQVYFKYCSTFDSRPTGNIGPVADALMDRLGGDLALVCPASPENGRTVYQGHLFVGDRLLSESGMQDHPLTPMTDPDLVRVLARQVSGPVGLLEYQHVRAGQEAIRRRLSELRGAGIRYVVADALDEGDLRVLGAAAAGHRLVTGAAGLALGLPANFPQVSAGGRVDLPEVAGGVIALAGSCSQATLGQLDDVARSVPVLRLDPLRTPDAEMLVAQAISWAEEHLPGPMVVATSSPPAAVAALQERLGVETAGALLEGVLATVADRMVRQGIGRLVVAGGETSGAVTARLGIRSLRVGPEIAPGVPWMSAEFAGRPLRLALKSGNFGGPDFFTRAFE